MADEEPVETGAAVVLTDDDPDAAGADVELTDGAAAWAGLVTGVTMTPVTFPVMSAFCFFPLVPRAARVARFLARAAIFCSKERGWATFLGATPTLAIFAASLLK